MLRTAFSHRSNHASASMRSSRRIIRTQPHPVNLVPGRFPYLFHQAGTDEVRDGSGTVGRSTAFGAGHRGRRTMPDTLRFLFRNGCNVLGNRVTEPHIDEALCSVPDRMPCPSSIYIDVPSLPLFLSRTYPCLMLVGLGVNGSDDGLCSLVCPRYGEEVKTVC